MKNAPDRQAVQQKVLEVFQSAIAKPIEPQKALIHQLGFDSLDLIEASFSLEDVFGFEFSDRNPVEALDLALGKGVLIQTGRLTEQGYKVVMDRMPELTFCDVPKDVALNQLNSYFSLDTFARLIHEFYLSLPDTCPETGEPVVIKDWKPVSEKSEKPVKALTGDQLIDQWVAEKVSAFQ